MRTCSSIKRTLGFISLLLLFMATGVNAKDVAKSDSMIKQQMIQESIASYSGNCPCPYNLAKNGSKCGARSAWSKKGGYAPLCYESDITDEMLKRKK